MRSVIAGGEAGIEASGTIPHVARLRLKSLHLCCEYVLKNCMH
jgi:hypothetical protein